MSEKTIIDVSGSGLSSVGVQSRYQKPGNPPVFVIWVDRRSFLLASFHAISSTGQSVQRCWRLERTASLRDLETNFPASSSDE